MGDGVDLVGFAVGLVLGEAVAFELVSAAAVAVNVEGFGTDAESDAVRNLEAQGVRRALSRLPVRDRALLVLRNAPWPARAWTSTTRPPC